MSHNNQILRRGDDSGIERWRHVGLGDPEVNSVGQDSWLLPGSCPAVDSTGYESKQRREHHVNVTSCNERLKAGNATTN
jgi:hypothetical protein